MWILQLSKPNVIFGSCATCQIWWYLWYLYITIFRDTSIKCLMLNQLAINKMCYKNCNIGTCKSVQTATCGYFCILIGTSVTCITIHFTPAFASFIGKIHWELNYLVMYCSWFQKLWLNYDNEKDSGDCFTEWWPYLRQIWMYNRIFWFTI